MLMLDWIRMHLKLTAVKIYQAIQKAMDYVYMNKRETGSWMKRKNLELKLWRKVSEKIPDLGEFNFRRQSFLDLNISKKYLTQYTPDLLELNQNTLLPL